VKVLGNVYRHDDNAITFLRFVLASAVIVHHVNPLGGFGGQALQAWSGGRVSLGFLAVGGFFCLSGFLLTQSLERDPSPGRYLVRRTVRIFPAYWFCLLVSALLIGPCLWWLAKAAPLATYFSSGEPVAYVLKNAGLVVLQRGISGLFADNPYRFDVNGSLWTLKFEFACYLALLAAHRLGLLGRHRGLLLSLMAFLLVANQMEGAWRMRVPDLPLYFFCGTLAHLYRHRLPSGGWFGAAALVLAAAAIKLDLFNLAGAVLTAVVVLWAAVALPVRWWKEDYSYGLYLFGFPIQQSLASLQFHHAGKLAYFAAGFAVTLLPAMLSWHLVEKPALAKARGLLASPRTAR
jgi:peptidoglycan/LPS O-acetylase OafA/YrhL